MLRLGGHRPPKDDREYFLVIIFAYVHIVNDEQKTAEYVSNVVRIHIASNKWRENESNVNESDAVYYHDCDEGA